MLVIGLTGGMGMGKTSAAAHFTSRGVKVFDADAYVHRLYEGEAVAEIEAAFPGSISDGNVDRDSLAQVLKKDAGALARLEAIVHPMVRDKRQRFLADQAKAGAQMVVLEIPLLFETGAENRCDAVVVVTAKPEIQRQRVLERSGMTQDRLNALLANQMPDAEKRRRAHFLVLTDDDLDSAKRQVPAIIRALAAAA